MGTAMAQVPVVSLLDDEDEGDVQERQDRTHEAGPSTGRQHQGFQQQQGRKRRRGQPQQKASPCVDLTHDVSDSESDPDEIQVTQERRAPPRTTTASSLAQQLNPAAVAIRAQSAPPAPPPPEEPGIKCAICLETIKQMSTTYCGHVFCTPCIKECIKAQKKCPKCRKGLTMKQIHRVYLD